MAKTPSKSNDPANNVFMREVEDAVRRSDREDFFRRYGWWLLAALVLILAAWGGYIWWQNSQAESQGKVAESYIHALDAIQDGPAGEGYDEALSTFEAIGNDGSDGYRAASQIMRANMLLARGEEKGALALYDKVAGDADLPQAYRDLAVIRATLMQYDDLDGKAIVEQLEPMAEPGRPFFGTAGELLGLTYVEMGNKDAAGKLFRQIAEDESVPQEIRARATLMTNQLGIDLDPNSEKLKQQVRGVQPAESQSGQQSPAG